MTDASRAPWLRPLLLVFVLLALLALSGRPQFHLAPGRPDFDSERYRNPYLLLGKLATELGSEVNTSQRFETIPPTPVPGQDTLWLSVPGRMISVAQADALQAWVESGGRLVLAPLTPELWETDPLLARFGVSLWEADDEEVEEYLGPAGDRPSIFSQGFFYDWDGESSVSAAFDPAQGIVTDDPDAGHGEWLLCDPVNCHAWRLTPGDGEVVVLTGAFAFDNDNLTSFDHAFIATRLLGSAPGTRLTIIHGETVPSLFVLLRTHAPFALLALAAAILLWILAAGTRFGPLRDDAVPARRRLGEHVAAAGRWYVRHGHHRRLWQAVHDDFRRTLHRRHPQAQGMNDEDLAVLIAGHAGIEPQQVHAALAVPGSSKDTDIDAATLARQIRRLDSLRRLL